MEKNLSNFIQFTSKNLKSLRKTLKNLKDEREAQLHPVRKPHAPESKKAKPGETFIYFSIGNVAKATITVLVLMALSKFLAEISSVIILFFISILFASALNPAADFLEKRHVPRAVSVLGMYLLLLFLLVFFISQLIPLVATQLTELAHSLTTILDKLSSNELDLPFGESIQPAIQDFLNQIDRETVVAQIKGSLENLSTQLEAVAGNTFGAIKVIFNGVINFVMVLVLTFFLVVNERSVSEFFISLFPSKHGDYIAHKIKTVQNKVGFWLQGQLTLMFLMFGMSLIGLLILGVDNALTLAMMTGIAELLPVVGPVAAGIPAVLVAFNESPWLAVWMIGLIALLQQIEGHILVPLVMRKAVGLNPIIIILAMLIGLETLGVVGMIMAVPVATTLSIFVTEYAQKEK
ncbi:AI-2E family transporter [Candidatus Peregrinibacteria bacterium]|nr:MAG: AI-2E family transporter [Candidatus Peregrinibacteria bacterium]